MIFGTAGAVNYRSAYPLLQPLEQERVRLVEAANRAGYFGEDVYEWDGAIIIGQRRLWYRDNRPGDLFQVAGWKRMQPVSASVVSWWRVEQGSDGRPRDVRAGDPLFVNQQLDILRNSVPIESVFQRPKPTIAGVRDWLRDGAMVTMSFSLSDADVALYDEVEAANRSRTNMRILREALTPDQMIEALQLAKEREAPRKPKTDEPSTEEALTRVGRRKIEL